MAAAANELLKLIDDNLPLNQKMREKASMCDRIGRSYYDLREELDQLWNNGAYSTASKGACAKLFMVIKRGKYSNTHFAVQSVFEPIGATVRSPAMMALSQQMIDSLYKKFNSKKLNYKNYMNEVKEYKENVLQGIKQIEDTIKLVSRAEQLEKLLPKVKTELVAFDSASELRDKIREVQLKIDHWESVKAKLVEKLSSYKGLVTKNVELLNKK